MTGSISTDGPAADAAAGADGPEATDTLGKAVPEEVEVRRRTGLAVLLAGAAWLLTAGYLLRVTGDVASWLDWTVFGVMSLLALVYTSAAVDGRTPLMVVDSRGVRFRQGPVWSGLAWSEVELVEHQPRRGLLRDGWILVAPSESAVGARDGEADLTVPLSLSTRVAGVRRRRVSEVLDVLSGDTVDVVEIDPRLEEETPEAPPEPVVEPRAEEAERPEDADVADAVDETGETDEEPRRRGVLSGVVGRMSRRARRERADETAEDPESTSPLPALGSMAPSPTPSPLRDAREAVRAQIERAATAGANALRLDPADDESDGTAEGSGLPEHGELRPGADVDATIVLADGALRDVRSSLADSSGTISPIARPGEPVEQLVVDDFPVEPAPDPVIGPELTAARTRLGLSVDRVAERTRIRPHVIESIEVDDFAPCGGDFYARGHLRTLARVLGVDSGPLLERYDEKYADAPIDPRRVFEAELATSTGGSIRGTRGGPNWSVLVAAVMAVVLIWSVARLVMETPVAVTPPTPRLNGSAGPNNSAAGVAKPVPVELTAAGGGARVIVRDGGGDVVYDGRLAFGQSVSVEAAPPVRVSSTDGSVEVSVDDKEHGALGARGEDAQDTFVPR